MSFYGYNSLSSNSAIKNLNDNYNYNNYSNYYTNANKYSQFSSFGQMTLQSNKTQSLKNYHFIKQSENPIYNKPTTNPITNNINPQINNEYNSNRSNFRNCINKNFFNMYNNNEAKNNEITNSPSTPYSNYSNKLVHSPYINQNKNNINEYQRLTNQFDQMNNIYNKYTTNNINNSSLNSTYNSTYNNNNYNTISNSKQSIQKIIKQFAYLSKAGATPDGLTKTNQDSYIFKEHSDGAYTFGVFDGHGNLGHFVSQGIKKYFESISSSELNTKDKILDTFSKLSKFISNGYDTFNSGSTCVLVHIDPNQSKIYCANVGDSRAIMISNSNKTLIQLSYDQKPDNPSERKRIESMGGSVERIYGLGPYRVWVKGEGYPGLAMSRSIGDRVAHTVGVSDIPEVLEFDINTTTPMAIVVCSDGVWEFSSNEEIKDIVYKYIRSNDANSCVSEIVDTAYNKWKKEGASRDDITSIVVFF